MHKDTERRIVRALTETSTPWWYIARAWNVSEQTILRIAKKHGVKKAPQDWYVLARGKPRAS